MTVIEHSTASPLLVVAALMFAVAVVLLFFPRYPAALAAYAGLWLVRASRYVQLTDGQMVFWGVAVAICVGLAFMLPQAVVRARAGVSFLAIGALAGTVVGMLLPFEAGSIVGSVVGTFFGAVAFARTPVGAEISFPSSKFLNYLCAKGLPMIVTCSIIALAMVRLIHNYLM